jgi:hypothetical protein
MPIGFPAYSEDTVRFRGTARKVLVRAALDALDELGWRPIRDSRDRIRASVPNAFHGIFMTWGAKFLVEIDDEELFIRSEGSVTIAWMDFGQHSHNIRRFLERVEEFLDENGDSY